MQGLRYYSTWNFGWWLAAQTGLTCMSGPLRTSIITTSLVGGYMTYIFPRKITYREKGETKVVPRDIAIALDIVGHQIPMITVCYGLYKNPRTTGRCGFYVVLPASLYALAYYLRGITLKDIYGISSHKMYFSCFGTLLCLGSAYHGKDIARLYRGAIGN